MVEVLSLKSLFLSDRHGETEGTLFGVANPGDFSSRNFYNLTYGSGVPELDGYYDTTTDKMVKFRFLGAQNVTGLEKFESEPDQYHCDIAWFGGAMECLDFYYECK